MAVLDGKVTQRTPMGLQTPLSAPEACAAAGQGRTIQAFRLRPGTVSMAFHDDNEVGWEYAAWSQNEVSLDYTYIVLGHDRHEPDKWFCWFRHGQGRQKMTFCLPEYDRFDTEAFMLDPLRDYPRPPSRYDVLGEDA